MSHILTPCHACASEVERSAAVLVEYRDTECRYVCSDACAALVRDHAARCIGCSREFPRDPQAGALTRHCSDDCVALLKNRRAHDRFARYIGLPTYDDLLAERDALAEETERLRAEALAADSERDTWKADAYRQADRADAATAERDAAVSRAAEAEARAAALAARALSSAAKVERQAVEVEDLSAQVEDLSAQVEHLSAQVDRLESAEPECVSESEGVPEPADRPVPSLILLEV